MSDLADRFKPDPKAVQLARPVRRYRRPVAGAKRWQQIADDKQGPCRICSRPPPNELHHVIPRDRGGSDTQANIVPLCHKCHVQVELRSPAACLVLVEGLWRDDQRPGFDEYSYAVTRGGEAFAETIYGITYHAPRSGAKENEPARG